MRDLGRVDNETPEEARKRRRREYQNEVDDRALDLIKNDPEVGGDMRKAKAKARELIAIENAYNSGAYDPDPPRQRATDEKGNVVDPDLVRDDPASSRTTEAKKSARRRTTQQSTSPRRRRPRNGRTGRRNGFATRSVRMVAAPYGSVASAAWTLGMGGLSIVILYSLLTREGSAAVAALFNGISSGIRRFSDPWTPLFPTNGETAPPAPMTKPGNRKRQLKRAGSAGVPSGISAAEQKIIRHPVTAGGR